MSATDFIGKPVKRMEDYRFLTGEGNYTDDIGLPHQTHAVFVRSPHAHARVKSIRSEAARKAPGVLAVYTGDDIAAARLNGLPCDWLITGLDGQPMKEPPHPVLEIDPAELRRRNFIRAFPYQTQVALPYDTGDCEATLAEAIKVADVAGFPARRTAAAARGKLRGLAHGIGQALVEGCNYDAQTGQLVTGSMMDYCTPCADDMPSFEVGTKETPCTHNPLGVKGSGEAGAIGSPAALINTITDALGFRDLAMPATPQRVWRAARQSMQPRQAA